MGLHQAIHSGRLERWLGQDRIENLSKNMRGWYGPPITLLDVPGRVQVGRDGDFSGQFSRGGYFSAADSFGEWAKRLWAASGRATALNTGFASLSDALARSSGGFRQTINGMIQKTGPTGVTAAASTLWRVGAAPAVGTTPSAAPGGNAPTSATTGAMAFSNPASANLRLVGADFSASVANNALLLYDRTFHVAKTMNSTATEAVTGVPTRYTSATVTSEAYAGGNFLAIEVGGTALAATAHNWTTCLYTNAAGTTGQTLPSVTGNSGAIVDRLDMPLNQWFCPLATGDAGISALTQMQCSALVATGLVNFVIGHPIGFMAFPVINVPLPFDWMTNRDLAPKITDSACLALMEMPKPSATATSYSGMIYATAAAT